MNWWDYVITAISVGCTVFSIIGAYKSNAYYKKSKQLTIYAMLPTTENMMIKIE